MKQSRQFIENRRNQIYKYISEKRKVRVEELSDVFEVSDLTIRRDLEELQKRKMIRKFFGGAEILEMSDVIDKSQEKETIHSCQKIMIADYVAKMIHDEKSIFINSGTTTLEVIRKIQSKKITIVTNNAVAGRALREDSNCELLCTGGLYSPGIHSFVGEYAASLIYNIYADIAVLGVGGISAEAGCSTALFQETALFQKMLEHCRGKKIIVADGSKVGKVQSYKCGNIDQIDTLITTSEADSDEIEKLKKLGVEVVVVD